MDLFEEFEEAVEEDGAACDGNGSYTGIDTEPTPAPPPPDDPDEDEGAGVVGGEGFVLIIGAKIMLAFPILSNDG